MIKHVLTENQAYRLGIPSLVGSEVQVILYEKHEKPTELANVPIARDVFYNGRRIGGNFCLDE